MDILLNILTPLIVGALGGLISYFFARKTERYKSKLHTKKYVSKVRFDAEFEIYREISDAFSKIYLEIITLVDKRNRICFDDDDIGNFGGRAEKLCFEQFTRIYSVAPFLQKNIWDDSIHIYEKFRCLLNRAMEIDNKDILTNQRSETDEKKPRVFLSNEKENEAVRAMNENFKNVENQYKDFLEKIRHYLNSLEAI
jgi:hypothetical protein